MLRPAKGALALRRAAQALLVVHTKAEFFCIGEEAVWRHRRSGATWQQAFCEGERCSRQRKSFGLDRR